MVVTSAKLEGELQYVMVVAAAAVGQTMPIECGAKGNTACVVAPTSKIMVVNMVFTSV